MNECSNDQRALKQKLLTKLFPSKLLMQPETDFNAKDGLIVETVTNFSLLDRVRVLITGKVITCSQTSTENVIGKCKTATVTWVGC